MQHPATEYIFEISGNNKERALDHLREHGFVVIRGVGSPEQIKYLDAATKDIISKPAIGGSIGFYMKDPYKKVYDALMFGRDCIDIVVDNRIIDIVESYTNDDCLLSEIFMKHDLGADEVYFPYHAHTGSDRVVNTEGPFGVGAIYYCHDTDEGAFCYSPGTHIMEFPHGPDPHKYPKEMKSAILSGMRRVAGRAGDIVLFDERGFHGPEQPTEMPRTVLIYGYQRKTTFGNTLRSPIPVLLNDLGHLSAKQLQVLGLGADSRKDLKSYHIYGFSHSRHYPPLARRFERMFERDRKWAKRKKLIKSLLGR